MEELRRGDIFWTDPERSTFGSEQQSGRPAVIISNDLNNRHSPTVEIVYLTTQLGKKYLPTHTVVSSAIRRSVVLCEQITTIDRQFLSEKIGKCTEDEMQAINHAVEVSLGLKAPNDADIQNFRREKPWLFHQRIFS